VSREYEPVVGQWYENVDEDETFRVITVDEDSELVEVEYEDGEVEELDMDTWREFNLEKTEQPEGWVAETEDDEEEDEEWDEDDDEDDEDDDLDDEEDDQERDGGNY
jgi:hypothetical protein